MRPLLSALDMPPFWLAAHLMLAWAVSFVPVRLFGAVGIWLGVALILAGLALIAAAVVEMARRRTTVIPKCDPSALVTSGVFRFSRNPIYLGDALVLAGAILFWDAALALPLVPLFIWLIQTRFIKDEEARLTLAFGPEFDLWAQHVRRWIGRR